MGDGGTQHNERAERRTVEDRPQKAPTRDSTVTPLDVEDGLSQHSDERVAVSPSPPKITAPQRSWLKRQQEEEEEESTDQATAQPKKAHRLVSRPRQQQAENQPRLDTSLLGAAPSLTAE